MSRPVEVALLKDNEAVELIGASARVNGEDGYDVPGV